MPGDPADGPNDAPARSIYDEQAWIEMIIVPRTAIREDIKA